MKTTSDFRNEVSKENFNTNLNQATFQHQIRVMWSWYKVDLKSLPQAEIKALIQTPSYDNLIKIIELSNVPIEENVFYNIFNGFFN